MTNPTLPRASVSVHRRIALRILPVVAICYAIAIMDRVNVGYASLTMSADIGLSAAAYGLGAGIFFLAYCLLEVPSNLLLERYGARVWISRIMLTWGAVVILTGFVQNVEQFYLARILLGAAEAGFYPGIVYFLSTWFPRVRLSRALAVLTIAGPVGNIVVGPFSGWILQATHLAGDLPGWRWLFIIQGIPALIMGVVFFAMMRDKPRDVKWLSPGEIQALESELQESSPAVEGRAPLRERLSAGLLNGRAWAVALLLGANYLGVYGVIFWLPTLIQSTGVESTLVIGLLAAIPWMLAIIVTLVIGRTADVTQRHRMLFAVGMVVAAIGLVVGVLGAGQTALVLVGASIATAAFAAVGPLVWVIADRRLAGTAGVAVAFGLINAVASIGSFLGPYVLGLGTELTGSAQSATIAVSIVVALAGGAVFLVGRRDRAEASAAEIGAADTSAAEAGAVERLDRQRVGK